MNNLKQLIRKNKNVILAIIAILLIIFTAYQLKLVGIAVADSAEIVEIEELAKAEEESKVGEQIVETIENVEEAIQIENITEDSNDANTEELPIETNIDNENTVDTSNEVTNSEVSEELKESTTTNTVENTFENVITDLENVTNTENIVTNTIEEENTVNDEIIDVAPTELVFDNGEYKVTVSAIKEDALKNIEKVNVTPITAETNPAEYNKISLKLQDKLDEDNLSKSEEEQTELVGFLAYDITLVDKDGIEAEPDGNVNVSFEYITVPEKVAECADAEVSVVHFEEDKLSGNVALKEFSQEEQKLNVETDSKNQIVKFDFETDSFSTFTITWSNFRTTYANITVHYVDSQGNEINGSQSNNINVSTNNTVNLSDYAGTINNYLYKSAHYNVLGGSEITSITFTVGNDAIQSKNNIYNVTFYNDSTEVANLDYSNSTRTIDIYLVYVKVGNIVLTDTIANDGNLNVIITDADGNDISSDYTFTWYKADSQTGVAEKVEKVKITGSTYNISNEGKSINVALDSGADKWYYAVATDIYGNTYTSETYHVDYYDDVRNGSFETPVLTFPQFGSLTSGAIYQYSVGTSGLIWKTTGYDKKIEIARNGTKDNSQLNYWYNNPDGANDGKQFAELNCEASGALYQDILTIPGEQLNWKLSHRGRNGTDTMYVVIMSTEDAEKYDVTTQEKVNYIIEHIDSFPGVKVWTLTDGNTAWGNHTGYYNVPDNQYLTRFFFVAGNTASGNETVGNFIDSISVGQDISPIVDGSAVVTVKKVIKGLSNEDDLTNCNLTIVESDNINENDISNTYTNFIWNTSEKVWYLEKTFEISTGERSSVEAIFSEISPENIIDGYSFVSSEYKFEENSETSAIYSISADNASSYYSTEELILEENNSYTLTFTNTYKSRNFSFEKYGRNQDGTTSLLEGATFTLSNGTGFSQIETSNEIGIVAFTKIPNGTYTLQETVIPENYKIADGAPESYTVNIENDNITVEYMENDETVSISGNEFSVINELDVTNIILNKQDVFGNSLGGATFKITKKTVNSDENPYTQTVEDTDNDGKFVFTNIKYGDIYEIEELLTPDDSKYYKMQSKITVSVSKDTGLITIENQSDNEIQKLVSLSKDGKEINVINLQHILMPKAGGCGTYIFYIIGAFIMGSTILIYKKKLIRKD